MRIKPISISLSPNTEQDDILLAFKLLLQPWLWKKGASTLALEQEFTQYIGTEYAYSFNSGRSALFAILRSLGLQQGDEVLLQTFTCNAVPNPVLWAGLKPVYVDCREDDFNINPVDLEKKITPKSRVVIIQHTFGLPADMDRIMEICNRRNIILVEDCAHALGATYKGKKVGTFGEAAFFSFSRDKVISCVYGGMATTNDPVLAENLKKFQETVGYPSLCWIAQQLLHPILMNWIILPTYGLLGKYLLIFFQWLHILSKAVHWKEKRGKMPGYFPRRLPNVLAILAFHQFAKLERFNTHRKQIAALYVKELSNTKYKILDTKYQEGNIFLRFPVVHPNAHEIIKKAWSQNLLIGDWYTTPIAPHDTQLDAVGYSMGSCPIAERLAKITLNLPTHIRISQKDAETIAKFLKSVET
ncbi:MAG: aminotransferase class I/II-fold pyridoxal phosphate-dependent enzyme [bacterium]|nr:aminotransferase class I/II-fold pyridoxal phosphate-dependent enzyme [bacterium]